MEAISQSQSGTETASVGTCISDGAAALCRSARTGVFGAIVCSRCKEFYRYALLLVIFIVERDAKNTADPGGARHGPG